MNGYRLTPAAQRDLSSIWEFTEERRDVRQAEMYLVEIREAVERLAADAARGRGCDEILMGYRRYAVGSHLIFYFDSDSAIDVIRIPHQRMDPTWHL